LGKAGVLMLEDPLRFDSLHDSRKSTKDLIDVLYYSTV